MGLPKGLITGVQAKLPNPSRDPPSLFRIERFASEIPDPALTLVFPWPPSVNEYWHMRPAGKIVIVYVAQDGKKFRRAVQAIVLSAGICKPLMGRLSVEVRCWQPNRVKIDLDNRLKALLDAMEAAKVYENDNQIDRLLVLRAGVRKPAGVEVRISEISAGSGRGKGEENANKNGDDNDDKDDKPATGCDLDLTYGD